MNHDLDLNELLRGILAGRRRVLQGLAAGVAAAAIILVAWPPRFEGRATLLVRTAPSTSSMLRGQLGGLADLAGGSLRVGAEAGELATEIGLLRSRALLGFVVDSLRLQLRSGRTPSLHDAPLDLPAGRFAPRIIDLGGRRARLVDREDAIDDLQRRLTVEESGGDLLEIKYAGRDSLSAAAAVNLLTARYMDDRRTVDRSVNQRRVEFLDRQVDSVRRALTAATATLRDVQQRSGVLSLEVTGQGLAQQVAGLTQEIATLDAESEALDSLLASVADLDSRRVAGFPSLLRSPAVNEIVTRMAQVQSEREVLLVEFTPSAPRVRAMDRSLEDLRSQLIPLARTYAAGLGRQRLSLAERVDRVQGMAPGVARAGEGLLNAEAEVKTLASLLLATSGQRLDARLAAIGEGGLVRIVDAAVIPRRPTFPRPVPTLLVGFVAGMVLGLVGALWSVSRPLPHH